MNELWNLVIAAVISSQIGYWSGYYYAQWKRKHETRTESNRDCSVPEL
jgi:hypothetical protein